MAITPNSYPFSGGAFMGGGGSPVNRDDIHTLNLTKNGESIGNYNPLVGDADVDVPSDAVVISFSTFSGTMPGSAYSKMASAVGAGQVVMLRSVSGASVVYWTLLAASVLSYKFISVSETAVLTVEIQTSGDSSGNHAFTISNVPLTELRVIDTGANSGDDRGHEHTRIAEALAAGKTVCIKYTSGNNIAYGTLCGAHDSHYTFIVDYGGTPSVLTVIADGSMQISAIFDGDASEFSVTPDGSSTGYNITGPTLLKVFLQKFKNLVSALKALAFKDNVSDSDISGTISDGHIASASTWNGKADKANITGATKCKITYNGQGIVTSGADLDASDIPNLPASKITSGTFNTGRIADDAITADKVKDNETLPVNISGSANRLQWGGGTDNANSVGYTKLVTINVSDSNTANAGIIASVSWRDSGNGTRTGEGLLVASFREFNDDTVKSKILILGNRGGGSSPPSEVMSFSLIKTSENIYELWGYVGAAWTSLFATILSVAGTASYPARSFQNTAPAGYSAIPYLFNVFGSGGSPTTPVYVDSNGQVQPCAQGATLKTNTATLYISGYYNNTPVYHVKDIKNGCVNYVHVKDTLSSSCNLTIEAPVLAANEEHDYVVVFDTFTNSNLVGNIDVENCKTTGHFESGVFVYDAMAISNATPSQVPMIIVTGNVARPQWYDRV